MEEQEKIEQLRSDLKTIKKEFNSIKSKFTDFDRMYSNDLTKHYGFDKENMYYIGVATGRIYTKQINSTIVEMISNINNLNWKDVCFINKFFMK